MLKLNSKNLSGWIGKFPANSSVFLISGRYISQIGGKIVNVASGLHNVYWTKNWWTTVFVNLVNSIIYAASDSALLQLFSR